MSNLQAQIAQYTSNESIKKSFAALYRLIKTHTLLKNLYLSQALNRDVYSREVKETLGRISMLKKELSNYDITRFCELWDITTEYEALNFQNEALASSLRVPIGVAKLANLLPRLNDEVFQASKYEQIHEILSTFCIQLSKLLQSDSSISPGFKRVINDLIALESRFAHKYERLTDQLQAKDKEQLREGLTKFRVQFQKSYQF